MTEEKRRLWINGITGRMGDHVSELVREKDELELVGGSSVDDQGMESLKLASEIIDFSTPQGTVDLFNKIQSQTNGGQAVLVATTGLKIDVVEEIERIAKEKNLKIMFAPNTSLGVLITLKAALKIAGMADGLFDVEIVETHHNKKIDAPSGTAKFFATHVAKEMGLNIDEARKGRRDSNSLGVHAIRGGGVFGEHSIRFLGEYEEISVTHRSFSRKLFAQGALSLVGWLRTQEAGSYQILDIS